MKRMTKVFFATFLLAFGLNGLVAAVQPNQLPIELGTTYRTGDRVFGRVTADAQGVLWLVLQDGTVFFVRNSISDLNEKRIKVGDMVNAMVDGQTSGGLSSVIILVF